MKIPQPPQKMDLGAKLFENIGKIGMAKYPTTEAIVLFRFWKFVSAKINDYFSQNQQYYCELEKEILELEKSK